jgi:beta-lactamase class A/beta-lactamase class A VEB
MIKLLRLTIFLLPLISGIASAQPADTLLRKIERIVSSRNAVVGVAISGYNGEDTLSVNGYRNFPMQSVFKFHIALAVLSEIDKGRFSLNQKIKIGKEDLLPEIFSPIKEKYPDGTTLTISEILKYTIAESDGIGYDLLLKLIGGPQSVEDYFSKNNFKDLSVKINEKVMQSNWDMQFLNWTTPKSANEILSEFYYNKQKLLSDNSYDFIWKLMKETETGKDRLKGQLPKGTIVAHKTGSSGVNEDGLTSAVNDIGIIFLPNGKHFFISVFVTNSKEKSAVNEKIIADIAKVTWDYFIARVK